MSVCEVGAMIGRLWRELDDIQKQRYNDAFTNDKVITYSIKGNYIFYLR